MQIITNSASLNTRIKFYINIALILTAFYILPIAFGQSRTQSKDTYLETFAKYSEMADRAGGTHNASNIGLFFENRGKLYPRYSSYGPGGEFPINSGRRYISAMGPMVGVAPDTESGRPANTIQCLWISNEEWEAVGGFHNPAATDIAFSDNNSSWPDLGWHIQDEMGEAIVFSSQDSYCVYNDLNNTVEPLGIQIAQTGYAYGMSFAEDLLFFTFEMTNNSSVTYDSVYFGLYLDIDVGHVYGGVAEYNDDLLAFDSTNNFVYFYDSDNYSANWGGATGSMGFTLLETPEIDGQMAGITDMHFNLWDHDSDNDSLQLTLLSSNYDYLPDNYLPVRFFHGSNQHIDDVGTMSSSGNDYVVTIGSGPYDLSPNDTLVFVSCIVAGSNESDIESNLSIAKDIYNNDFITPKPPPSPTLTGVAGDNTISLYWTDEVESIPDVMSGELDFEGYHIYRSLDKGFTWDQIDRNLFPETGVNAVPLKSYDRINGVGDDLGIAYTFTDETTINGFEYWYSITAYDHGGLIVEKLESGIGNSTDAINTISIVPVSPRSAYIPATGVEITHNDSGPSNYTLGVTPLSTSQLSNFSYELTFSYVQRHEIGNPGVDVVYIIYDSARVPNIHYGFEFTAENLFTFHDLGNQEILYADAGFTYVNYYEYLLVPDAFYMGFVSSDDGNVRSAGDLISLNFCAQIDRFDGVDTVRVLEPQRFDAGTELVTDDGVSILMEAQPELQDIDIPPILDFDISFEVDDSDDLIDESYQLTVDGSSSDSLGEIFLVVSVSADTVINPNDTLYNGSTSYFNGISATFYFNDDSPPPIGSTATLSSLPAISPTILDSYTFGVASGRTDPLILESAMEDIRVVPNPYIVGSLWEEEFGETRKEPIRKLQFTHLPAECEIFIFTLAGDLIKTLEHNTDGGTETWDMRAEGGREIASGIYLYQVRANDFEYFNRFAVIK